MLPGNVRAAVICLWPTLVLPASAFPQDQLLALFKYLWYCTDGPERPTELMTIYVGQPTDVGQPLGLSWKTDEAVALQHALDYSFTSDAECLAAVTSRRAVLARFVAEDEVVVDPALLTDVRLNAPFMHIGSASGSSPIPFTAFSGRQSLTLLLDE